MENHIFLLITRKFSSPCFLLHAKSSCLRSSLPLCCVTFFRKQFQARCYVLLAYRRRLCVLRLSLQRVRGSRWCVYVYSSNIKIPFRNLPNSFPLLPLTLSKVCELPQNGFLSFFSNEKFAETYEKNGKNILLLIERIIKEKSDNECGNKLKL